jgi:hypothetical protein
MLSLVKEGIIVCSGLEMKALPYNGKDGIELQQINRLKLSKGGMGS